MLKPLSKDMNQKLKIHKGQGTCGTDRRHPHTPCCPASSGKLLVFREFTFLGYSSCCFSKDDHNTGPVEMVAVVWGSLIEKVGSSSWETPNTWIDKTLAPQIYPPNSEGNLQDYREYGLPSTTTTSRTDLTNASQIQIHSLITCFFLFLCLAKAVGKITCVVNSLLSFDIKNTSRCDEIQRSESVSRIVFCFFQKVPRLTFFQKVVIWGLKKPTGCLGYVGDFTTYRHIDYLVTLGIFP